MFHSGNFFAKFLLLVSWLSLFGSQATILRRSDTIDLDTEWQAVVKNSASTVNAGEAKLFPIALGRSAKFTTKAFQGCGIFTLMGNKGVIIGHMREEGKACQTLLNEADTSEWVEGVLFGTKTVFDSQHCDTGRAYLYGTAPKNAPGVQFLIGSAGIEGFDESHISYKTYIGSSGGDAVPKGVFQKMLVIWDSPSKAGGKLKFYFMSNSPVATLEFDAHMNLKTGGHAKRAAACAIRRPTSTRKAATSHKPTATKKGHGAASTHARGSKPTGHLSKTRPTAAAHHPKKTAPAAGHKGAPAQTKKHMPAQQKPAPTEKPTTHGKPAKGSKDKGGKF